MTLRKATINDIPHLIKLRMDYLNEDSGKLSLDEESRIKLQLEQYFTKHIPNKSFIGILAEDNGNVVSTAFLAISEKPANQSFLTGITGTLLNVLTYSEHRRKGYATLVMKAIIEEAKLLGVSSIDLSATNDGRLLYEKIGFHISQYCPMRMKITED